MPKPINPVVIDATVSGSCPKCRDQYKGFIDLSLMKQNASVRVWLKCENNLCGHLGKYFFRWPDELPKVILRHARSGELLRSGSKRKNRKKKKNPDQVLRGQLAFPITQDAEWIR